MSALIRVLVVDDHYIVRRGLAILLVARNGMQMVGEAADGEEAIVKARQLRPDVIIMDLIMPKMGGLEAIRLIGDEEPAARILALTSFEEDSVVMEAVAAGALGYLGKDSSTDDLLLADPSENLLSSLDFALLAEQDVEIVGKVMTVEGLQLSAQDLLPDLVLLDWQLGKAHRQTLSLSLHQLRPGLKVVAIVMQNDEGRSALAAGTDAFVSKSEPPDWLLDSVRRLAAKPPTGPTLFTTSSNDFALLDDYRRGVWRRKKKNLQKLSRQNSKVRRWLTTSVSLCKSRR